MDIAIGRGKIVDATGQESSETDLIVYCPRLVAPLLYAPTEGLFPVEACFFAIEVKTVLTATEIKDSLAKARQLRKLRLSSGKTAPPVAQAVWFLLFAFSSDLVEDGKGELHRYRELDEHADTDPLVCGLCVAGRGQWIFSRVQSPPQWFTGERRVEHDEILDFVGGVVHSLPDNIAARGSPSLGKYLLEDKPYVKG